MLRSTVEKVSAPSDKDISWLNHTPLAAAVYASWPSLPSAHATLASRWLATPYLGWTFTRRRGLLAASVQMKTDCSISPAMFGNGPTPALFGLECVIQARRRLRRPIVAFGWWKDAIAHT